MKTTFEPSVGADHLVLWDQCLDDQPGDITMGASERKHVQRYFQICDMPTGSNRYLMKRNHGPQKQRYS